MKSFPLFPVLTEEAQKEAEELITTFKERLKEVADDVIGELYTDIIYYIESDSWTNFRNDMLDGFRDYNNSKIQGEYDFKKIRRKLYEEYKEEISKDLNQDILEENKRLKEQLEFERNLHRRIF